MTAPLAVQPPRRPLAAAVVRLRPAPSLEPPVELARPTRRHLRVVHPPVELPFGDAVPPAVLPLPPRVDVPDEKTDPFGPLPTSRSALSDPAEQARSLVVAVLEVLGGRRPLQQLMPHLDEAAYESVARQLAASLRRPPDSGPAAEPSPTGGTRNRLGIGTPRVCEPADGVAEVTLVVRWGGRVRAVAMRLEGIDGRWRCTVLDIL